MRSFLLPDSRWAALHEGLRPRLEEAHRARDRFARVERRLRDGVAEVLRAAPLPESDALRLDPAMRLAPLSTIDALSFFTRHARNETLGRDDQAIAEMLADDDRPLDTPRLAEWHRRLLGEATSHAGMWKTEPNILPSRKADGRWYETHETVPPEGVVPHLDRLHRLLAEAHTRNDRDPLLVLAAYGLDLIKIHPFTDGTGRMVRFTMLWLLRRAGYGVSRYASFDTVLSRWRWRYLDAQRDSWIHWNEGQHDPAPWMGLIVDSVLEMHRMAEGLAERIAGWADQVDRLNRAAHAIGGNATRKALLAADPAIDPRRIGLLLRARERSAP